MHAKGLEQRPGGYSSTTLSHPCNHGYKACMGHEAVAVYCATETGHHSAACRRQVAAHCLACQSSDTSKGSKPGRVGPLLDDTVPRSQSHDRRSAHLWHACMCRPLDASSETAEADLPDNSQPVGSQHEVNNDGNGSAGKPAQHSSHLQDRALPHSRRWLWFVAALLVALLSAALQASHGTDLPVT